MRNRTYGELGLLGAILFVLGWLSGSSLDPPVATTAGRLVEQPRVVLPAAVPRIEHLDAHARREPPRTRRNPFVFERAPGRTMPAVVPPAEDREPSVDEPREAAALPSAVPASPWRMVGAASAADGTWTAIISGGGDVHLVGPAGTLPGGWTVVTVDATGATLRDSAGVEQILTLP